MPDDPTPKLCECGCGLPAPLAAQTRRNRGYVKGEPQRYIRDHVHRNWALVGMSPTNPSGLCQCGCGSATSIAARSNTEYGHVKGQPVRYIVGHSGRNVVQPAMRLCACGCGGFTNTIRQNDASKGLVVGEGKRYIRGHQRKRWHRAEILPSDYDIEDRGFITPCWIWGNSLNGKGYGTCSRAGKNSAHRIAYEQFREPIPPKMTVDHLCRQPPCVNPWHMEIVTASENSRRALRHRSEVSLSRKLLQIGTENGWTPPRS